MAKANGIIKIEGSVEDLTFYRQDGKNFVRKRGGVSKERIDTEANFVRTRENNAEFGHSGSSGKLLTLALGSLAFKAKDSRLSSRLLRTMSRIKNLDAVSKRGERKVSIGLATPEGKMELKGFNFNVNAPLQSVLFAPYVLTTSTGVFSFTDFITDEQLMSPQGATHVSLQSGVLAIDFDTEVSELAVSPIENLPINLTASSPTLTPSSVPTGTGVQLFLLMVAFYQEVNGTQYSLRNNEYNVLYVAEVI
jgi:hypothetical protein